VCQIWPSIFFPEDNEVTENKVARELSELQSLFAILNVDKGAACIMAGVSIRAGRRYWNGEQSPTIDKLDAIRSSAIKIANETGPISRVKRKMIREQIGQHMLNIVDSVIG
jgi:hypothetical protein